MPMRETDIVAAKPPSAGATNDKATRWGGLELIGCQPFTAPDHNHLSWKLADQAIQ